MAASNSIVPTLTSGIQDVAALLPLLGTDQCEDNVGSALSDGYLYAAATPLSIFGSLGTARAGFKALVADISLPGQIFFGAEILRAMGFRPSGKNLSLIMMDPENMDRHLAETRLDARLKTQLQLELLHMEDLSRLKVSTTCYKWNIKMLFLTALACSLGIAPYIHLNVDSGGNRLDLFTRWAFPFTRVIGGFLTATSLQFLIQRRLLVILKKRLIFHALNNGENASIFRPRNPSHSSRLWDLKMSSERCLSKLEQLIRRITVYERIAGIIPAYLRTNRSQAGAEELGEDVMSEVDDIDKGIYSPGDLELGEVGSDRTALRRLGKQLEEANTLMFPIIDSVWGFVVRVLMALGIVASVAGYVGCFSVVQGAGSSRGPALWLVGEGLLSILRMALWGWNPDSDDADPVKISFELDSNTPLSTCNKSSDEIFDDKVLPLVRASDFLRSLRSYVGSNFLKPFDDMNTSIFYTVAPEPSEAGVDERALFITMVDRRVRNTALVYYEDKEKNSHFLEATPPTVTATILETRIIGPIAPGDLPRNSPDRYVLHPHYQCTLRQLRPRDGESLTLVDEIHIKWTLLEATMTRISGRKTGSGEHSTEGQTLRRNVLTKRFG